MRTALGLSDMRVLRPAATPSRPSASSGTTATTWWHSNPASSSPTSATPDQHEAAQGGHRGHHDRGQRARSRPRRVALHDVPARARRRRTNPQNKGDRHVQPPQPQFPQGDRLQPRRTGLPAEARRRRSRSRSMPGSRCNGSTAKKSRSSSRRVPRAPGRPSRSPPSTRAPTSPTSTQRGLNSAIRSPWPIRRASWAGCTTRSSSGETSQDRTSRNWPRTRAYPSTTASPMNGIRRRCSPTS